MNDVFDDWCIWWCKLMKYMIYNDEYTKTELISNQLFFCKNLFNGEITVSDWSYEATNSDGAWFGEVDGAIIIDVTNSELHWWFILGSDDSIGVVTLSGKIQVSHFVLLIDAALHSGIEVSSSSFFHFICGNLIYYLLSFNTKILFFIYYNIFHSLFHLQYYHHLQYSHYYLFIILIILSNWDFKLLPIILNM